MCDIVFGCVRPEAQRDAPLAVRESEKCLGWRGEVARGTCFHISGEFFNFHPVCSLNSSVVLAQMMHV